MDISIVKELQRFESHIEEKGNTRILFSGIFGIGKTYFLKEFFKNNNNYDCVFLRPINYSIASNEDIINYIKYDIAFELLGKNIEFEKTDISKHLSAQYYVKDNLAQVVSSIAKMSGQIGKPIANIIDGLQALNKKIENHNKENQVNEKKEITDFLEQISKKEGSIYEENNITELISALVQSLKENDDEDSAKKETVLVIDDFDRLDPEHIFRILNVFACHFDLDSTEENKFGFDKVIVVGDIENIRNIFQAKYGVNTDFNGYIDKFYSTEIYDFSNKKVLKGYLYDYIKRLKVGQALFLEDSHSIIVKLLSNIFRNLVDYDLLNIRILESSVERNHELETITFVASKGHLSSYDVSIINVFQLLVSIFGSILNTKIVLEKFAQRNPLQKLTNKHILEPILMLLDYEEYTLIGEGDYIYQNADLNIQIHYSLKYEQRQSDLLVTKIVFLNDKQKELSHIPLTSLLFVAFQKYLSLEKVNY